MEALFGLQGKDFVVMVADMTTARSILCYNHDEDKIVQLDSTQLLGLTGEHSARTQFSEYISKNLKLMKLRSGRSLSNHAASNFIRNEIAEALRTRGAYQVNCLFASFDSTEGPALYYLDYLGTMQKMQFGAHGYGATFATAQMDANFRDSMNAEQAVELMKQCCDQLARRYLINLPIFNIKVLTEKEVTQELYEPKFRQDA